MTFQELTTVAPFVAAILTAIAILLVDLAWPNRSALAVGTALIGLAITPGWSSSSAAPGPSSPSVARTRSTPSRHSSSCS